MRRARCTPLHPLCTAWSAPPLQLRSPPTQLLSRASWRCCCQRAALCSAAQVPACCVCTPQRAQLFSGQPRWRRLRTARTQRCAPQPRRLPQSTPKGVFFLSFFLSPLRAHAGPAPSPSLPASRAACGPAAAAGRLVPHPRRLRALRVPGDVRGPRLIHATQARAMCVPCKRGALLRLPAVRSPPPPPLPPVSRVPAHSSALAGVVCQPVSRSASMHMVPAPRRALIFRSLRSACPP